MTVCGKGSVSCASDSRCGEGGVCCASDSVCGVLCASDVVCVCDSVVRLVLVTVYVVCGEVGASDSVWCVVRPVLVT